MIVLWWQMKPAGSFFLSENFTTRFPSTYEDRIRQLCKLGYKSSGYVSEPECLAANKEVLENSALKQVYSTVINDDSVYACMMQQIAAGKDLNDCVRSYLILHPGMLQELERAEKHTDGSYQQRMQTLCKGASLQDCESQLPKDIGESSAWREFVETDAVYNALQKAITDQNQDVDVALLQLLKSNDDFADSFSRGVFPFDKVSRESTITDDSFDMSYEDKVKVLCEKGYKMISETFADPETCLKSKVIDVFLHDDTFRDVFSRVLSDKNVFGCLINNMDQQGDGLFCLIRYFKDHPEDYIAVKEAASKYNFSMGESAVDAKALDLTGLRNDLGISGCEVLNQAWKVERESLQTQQTVTDEVKTSCQAMTNQVADAIITAIVKVQPDKASYIDTQKSRIQKSFSSTTTSLCNRPDMTSAILMQADDFVSELCQTDDNASLKMSPPSDGELPTAVRSKRAKKATNNASMSVTTLTLAVQNLARAVGPVGVSLLSKLFSDMSSYLSSQQHNITTLSEKDLEYVELRLVRAFTSHVPMHTSLVESDVMPILREISRGNHDNVDACMTTCAQCITLMNEVLRDVSTSSPRSTSDFTQKGCNLFSVATQPDGSVKVTWQSSPNEPVQAPKLFKDFKTFDQWWSFIVKNVPSLAPCDQYVQSVKRTCTKGCTVPPPHLDNSAKDMQAGAQANALLPASQASVDMSNQLSQAQRELHPASDTNNTLTTANHALNKEKLRLQAALSLEKKKVEELLEYKKKYGFVYSSPQAWYPYRPPVCLTDKPSSVYPSEDKYPPNLMQLDMWS